MYDGGLSILPPRYFRNLRDFDNAEYYYEMAAKQNHALAANCLSALLQDDGDARSARWWLNSAVNTAKERTTHSLRWWWCNRRSECKTCAPVRCLQWLGLLGCVAFSFFFLDCDASSCNPVANGAFAWCFLPVLFLFIYFCNIRLDSGESVEMAYIFCVFQGLHVWLRYRDSSSSLFANVHVLGMGVMSVVSLASWLHLCRTLFKLENERILQEFEKQREASLYI